MVRKKQKETQDNQYFTEKNVSESSTSPNENKDSQVEEIGKTSNENNSTQSQEALKSEEILQMKYNELNDKYIRLVAEFDNYRKRTLKERIELIKSGGEDVLKDILPVIDDLERAIKNIESSSDIEAVKIGILLIYSKFQEFLKLKGLKEIEALHQEFDIDRHEAVTKIPSPTEELRGKVVDVLKKGYYLHDRVFRFAQVVVGE